MKLLFDQNLSPRLVRLLADLYPGSVHVHELGLDAAPDTDADFHETSMLLGHPPKVIWIRLGNCSVNESAALLGDRSVVVRHLHEDPDAAFPALARNR